jgi:hypothetical protein
MEVGALKAAMTASDSDMAFGTIRYASLDFNPIQIPNQNPTIGRCQDHFGLLRGILCLQKCQ